MLFLPVAFLLSVAGAQSPGYRPQPNYVTAGKPDQAEGARVLAEFRQAGIAGTYWLAFELRVMPRRGAETSVTGQMLGTRSDRGPLSRIVIGSERWLIQSGPQSSAWRASDTVPVHRLPVGESLEPLAGTDLTVFDLQMPFFYWTDYVYEGLTRVRGRPAHGFVLYPPADLAAARPGLTGVRILVDSQFQALVQAELLGMKAAVDKTISILDLKKVGEHWIPQSIDFRNNLTRGKTRFTVTAAGLDLTLPEGTFAPDALGDPLPQIPPEKIEQL